MSSKRSVGRMRRQHKSPTDSLLPTDMDTVLAVFWRTFFSPAFAVFFPLLSMTNHPSFPSFDFSLRYYYTTLVVHLLFSSSYVWRNKLWLAADGSTRGGAKRVLWGLLMGRGSMAGSTKWEDQVVLITGGSGGLGSSIVDTLARMGVTVFVLDVVPPPTTSSTVHFVKCDVTDPRSVKMAADEARRVIREEADDIGVDGPTILINNAGVVNAKLIVDLTPEEVQRCAVWSL